MDTTATIPTGSMAERWKWKSFVGWGLFCGAIYYPLFGAWTWGGGWLSQLGNSMHLGLGYVDFAGSGVVHSMGGAAALAGALVLGPRIGKFNKDGSANTIGGHHIPMAMLGTFILLFGWFGFNAAVDVRGDRRAVRDRGGQHGDRRRLRRQRRDGVLHAHRCEEARPGHDGQRHARRPGGHHRAVRVRRPLGRGASSASSPVSWSSCRSTSSTRSASTTRSGAISVHGICGAFGVLAIGIFANGSYGAGWNGTAGTTAAIHGVTGILGGNFSVGLGQLGAQAIGVIVIWTVMLGIAYAFFKIQNAVTKGGIRTPAEEELAGLDMPEMGVLAYPEFAPFNTTEGGYENQPHAPANLEPGAIPEDDQPVTTPRAACRVPLS